MEKEKEITRNYQLRMLEEQSVVKMVEPEKGMLSRILKRIKTLLVSTLYTLMLAGFRLQLYGPEVLEEEIKDLFEEGEYDTIKNT